MFIKTAQELGSLIRQKRKAQGLTQEELAKRCGVGLRFIIELEWGKPSCQLGKALTVAAEVGVRLGDNANPQKHRQETTGEEDDPLSHLPTFSVR